MIQAKSPKQKYKTIDGVKIPVQLQSQFAANFVLNQEKGEG
jgi:hypothetical protein